jgi:outer membrane lipoprotein-sorting protein
LAACGDDRSPAQKLAAQVETGLAKLRTVQGRLEIGTGGVVLEQELWVQRPKFLRTETEAGPAEFKGTIVVLNEQESWFYNPAVNLVTLADRSQLAPDLPAEAGAGSMLERLPGDLLTLLQAEPQINTVGNEVLAGRNTAHIEIINNGQTAAFPAGLLQVWLDDTYYYPLGVQLSSGLTLRFRTVEFNAAIDPLTFTFVPPPGVPVQKVGPE